MRHRWRLLRSGAFWIVAKEDEDGSTSLTGRAMAPSTGRGRRLGSSWFVALTEVCYFAV